MDPVSLGRPPHSGGTTEWLVRAVQRLAQASKAITPAALIGYRTYYAPTISVQEALDARPRLLAASGVAVSHTGDLVETTLATVTVPGGAMGPNGFVLVESLWRFTGSTNNKIMKIKFGGTNIVSNTQNTLANVFWSDYRKVANRNSVSSQVFNFAANAFTSGGTTAVGTAAKDTSADVSITFTAQLANTGETIVLEHYAVSVYRAP